MAGRLLEGNEYRFGPKDDWSIVVANTQALREKAFKLVHYIYIGTGYAIGPKRESGLWCTIHHLHPNTLTFLATKAGRVAGTVSVVPDSRLGLPADIIFPERLAALRKAGRRLSEVFSLGVDEGITHTAIDLTLHLYRLVYLAATRLLHNTDIVASVMAHHATFYSKFLLFDEVFADSRQSPKTGEQVIFTRMNLETMESRYARRYSRLKGKRNLHRWFFRNEEEQAIVNWIRSNRRPMTADELNYFGAEKSHALSEADSDTVAVLREYCRNADAARDQDRRGD
ncbi:MAG: N-acyl amino acid synthase FeeM domain-containing protein [Syntrophales bacterium]